MALSLDPPSPEDLQILESVLLDYQRRLKTIQDLIELEGQGASESDMSQGLNRVELIARHRVMACMNVGAAWRRVPPELWDNILAFYMRATLYDADGKGPGRCVNAPDTLMRVCKGWRTVVLSSPSVWTDVILALVPSESALGSVPTIPFAVINRLVPRLNYHAERGFLWHLTMVHGKGSAHSTVANHGLTAETLIRNHPAFHSVNHLKIVLGPCGSALLPKLGQMLFPAVSSALIYSMLGAPGDSDRADLPQLPALKKAVLVDVTTDWHMQHNIPWSDLTHLVLGYRLDSAHVQALLRLCKSLRRAYLDTTAPSGLDSAVAPWYTTPSHATSVLRHLEELTVYYTNSSLAPAPMSLFDNFSFPSMTTYCLFLDKSGGIPHIRPFSSITHLTFNLGRETLAQSYSAQFLPAIFDTCPLIVELVATIFTSYIEHVLDALTFNPTNPRGVHLQTLVLLWNTWSLLPQAAPTFPLQRFYDFVASRRPDLNIEIPTPAALNRFIIRLFRFNDDTGADLLSTMEPIGRILQEFTSSGLELSLETTSKSPACRPNFTGGHWDEDSGVIQEDREFTTSMHPSTASYS